MTTKQAPIHSGYGAQTTAREVIGDRRLDGGTHLMHLETGRRALYEAVGRALKGELS